MPSIAPELRDWPADGHGVDAHQTVGSVLDAQAGPTLLVFLRHFG